MDCLAEPVPSLRCAGVSIVPSKYVNTCALPVTVGLLQTKLDFYATIPILVATGLHSQL